jgi:hypothetical protein
MSRRHAEKHSKQDMHIHRAENVKKGFLRPESHVSLLQHLSALILHSLLLVTITSASISIVWMTLKGQQFCWDAEQCWVNAA